MHYRKQILTLFLLFSSTLYSQNREISPDGGRFLAVKKVQNKSFLFGLYSYALGVDNVWKEVFTNKNRTYSILDIDYFKGKYYSGGMGADICQSDENLERWNCKNLSDSTNIWQIISTGRYLYAVLEKGPIMRLDSASAKWIPLPKTNSRHSKSSLFARNDTLWYADKDKMQLLQSIDFGMTWLNLSGSLFVGNFIECNKTFYGEQKSEWGEPLAMLKYSQAKKTFTPFTIPGLSKNNGYRLACTDNAVIANSLDSTYKSLDWGQNWLALKSSIDLSGAQLLSSIDDTLYASFSSTGPFISVDNGSNWSKHNKGAYGMLSRLFLADESKMILLIYFGGNNYITYNRGITWSTFSNQFTNGLSLDNGVLYGIGKNGRIYSSTDDGINWKKKSDGPDTSKYYIDVSQQFLVKDSLIIINGIRSKNLGRTWDTLVTQGSNNIAFNVKNPFICMTSNNAPVRSFCGIDTGDTWNKTDWPTEKGDVTSLTSHLDTLHIGFENGEAFYSIDSGKVWSPFVKTINNLAVLSIMEVNGTLIAHLHSPSLKTYLSKTALSIRPKNSEKWSPTFAKGINISGVSIFNNEVFIGNKTGKVFVYNVNGTSIKNITNTLPNRFFQTKRISPFTIEVNSTNGELFSVEVYNSMGQLIQKENGNYRYRLEINNHELKKRFLVVKQKNNIGSILF